MSFNNEYLRDPDLVASDKFDNEKFMFGPIELNWGLIHGVLTSGIEGGMTRQWAYIDVGPHQLGWANYFTATFEDSDDGRLNRGEGKSYQLSKESIIKGLEVLSNNYKHLFADILTGDYDEITGDALIQAATLGDVIYG